MTPRPAGPTVAWPAFRVDLFLPYLPTRALAPNSDRSHWSEVNSERATLRGAALAHGRDYLREGFERASNPTVGLLTGRLCYRRPTPPLERRFEAYERPYRPTDPDDLLAACKAALDGLVEAGVIAEDEREVLTLMAVEIDPVERFGGEGLRFRFA